jgi:hypothetical protein
MNGDRQALLLICIVFVSCGRVEVRPAGAAESGSQNTSTQAKPATKSLLPVAKPHQPLGPLLLVKHADGGSCQALLVARNAAILPSHCLPRSLLQTAPRLVLVPSVTVSVQAMIDPAVPGAEPFALLSLGGMEAFHVSVVDPGSASRPEFLPEPYRLHLAYAEGPGVRESSCRSQAYNFAGSVSYSCDTLPGHSGALVKDQDGRPFAIHLGVRNSLGYGVLLSVLSTPLGRHLKDSQEK